MKLNFFFDLKKNEYALVSLLFLNFFFIIVTYYISKPVRSALVVTDLGSKSLPYIWILGSIALGLFVSAYSQIIDKMRRDHLIALTIGLFIVTVFIIRLLLHYQLSWLSAVFYLWSDVFSVIVVEQFWSFCNDLFDTEQAKRLYGLIGGGGILGGVCGSALTDVLVPYTGTLNLLYVCAMILGIVIIITYTVQKVATQHKQLYQNTPANSSSMSFQKVKLFDSFKLVAKNPYLRSILIFVLLTQAVSNIIDYQFNVNLEQQFAGMDDKTTFISKFYFWLNLFSFLVMSFAITPLQKTIGILGSLLVLPSVDTLLMTIFVVLPSAGLAYGMKFFDKALNYSISRVSKEMLYIPTTKEAKYKAKAVIDMFAFRFSKILSFTIIVPFTSILSLGLFHYVSLGLMIALLIITWHLGKKYVVLIRQTRQSVILSKEKERVSSLAKSSAEKASGY